MPTNAPYISEDAFQFALRQLQQQATQDPAQQAQGMIDLFNRNRSSVVGGSSLGRSSTPLPSMLESFQARSRGIHPAMLMQRTGGVSGGGGDAGVARRAALADAQLAGMIGQSQRPPESMVGLLNAAAQAEHLRGLRGQGQQELDMQKAEMQAVARAQGLPDPFAEEGAGAAAGQPLGPAPDIGTLLQGVGGEQAFERATFRNPLEALGDVGTGIFRRAFFPDAPPMREFSQVEDLESEFSRLSGDDRRRAAELLQQSVAESPGLRAVLAQELTKLRSGQQVIFPKVLEAMGYDVPDKQKSSPAELLRQIRGSQRETAGQIPAGGPADTPRRRSDDLESLLRDTRGLAF